MTNQNPEQIARDIIKNLDAGLKFFRSIRYEMNRLILANE